MTHMDNMTIGQLSLLSFCSRPVPACMARIKAGCVHLCWVEGNNIWSHMAIDIQLWKSSGNVPYQSSLQNISGLCSIYSTKLRPH